MPDTEPIVRQRNQGESVWWSRGSIVTVKVGAEETGGSLSLAEQICPPRYEAPLHVHNDHDELLLPVDGQFDIYFGENHRLVNPGEPAYFPKGVVHGFRNTEDRVSKLHIVFEPGLERGFLEAGVPVETPADGLPDPPSEIAEAEKLIDVDRVYDTEIIDPLPDPEQD